VGDKSQNGDKSAEEKLREDVERAVVENPDNIDWNEDEED
jgi:hypothetical protein